MYVGKSAVQIGHNIQLRRRAEQAGRIRIDNVLAVSLHPDKIDAADNGDTPGIAVGLEEVGDQNVFMVTQDFQANVEVLRTIEVKHIGKIEKKI